MSKVKKNKSVWSSRILNENSNNFKKFGSSICIDRRLFKEDISASMVHIEMLCKQKIISLKVKNKIIWGLKKILNEIVKKKFNFDIKHEDIHMNIENRLFEIIGEDAGYLHTARSRNDQVITDFKLWIRKANKEIIKNLDTTIKIILSSSEKHIYTIMPGFTHLKNAQPISLAHYLLAYVEMFSRDKKRFLRNLSSLLENPLGVGALSGTSYNIDRNYTTKKLKFDSPTNNSIDTVLKGLPLSYFKDLQDDKKFIFDAYDQLKNSIMVMNEVLKNILFNKKNMQILAEKGFITSTDFADYLVKVHNYPFRKAYQSTASLVNYCEKKNKKLSELTINEIRKIEPKLNDKVLKVFNLKNSIDSKKSYGGTSFGNIKKMINKYKKEIK